MGENYSENGQDGAADEGTPFTAAPPVLDHAEFLPMMEEFECSEEEKIEFLETLWSIMTSFVDLGFGLDSLSILLPELAENPLDSGRNAVSSNNIPDTNNDKNMPANRAEKGGV